jgi:hypothetical protein
MQKLKRHGNGGSCLKKHEKLKIKIFAERVMENHIYSSIDFYISISKKHCSSTGPQIYMKETIFYVFLASSVIFDAHND